MSESFYTPLELDDDGFGPVAVGVIRAEGLSDAEVWRMIRATLVGRGGVDDDDDDDGGGGGHRVTVAAVRPLSVVWPEAGGAADLASWAEVVRRARQAWRGRAFA